MHAFICYFDVCSDCIAFCGDCVLGTAYVSCVQKRRLCGNNGFFVSVAALLAITGNILSTVLFATAYALPGMVFGIAVGHNKRFFYSVAATAVAVLFGIMLELLILNGSGGGIEAMLREITAGMEKSMTQILSASEMTNGGDAAKAVPQLLSLTVDMFMIYLPSIIIISSVVYAYIISAIGIFFLKRLRVKKIDYVKFSMIRAPRSMCHVLVILLLLCNIIDKSGFLHIALKNLSIVIGGAMSVCGLSFIDRKFKKRLPSGYVRAMIYCAVLFFGFFLSPVFVNILMIIGYMDGFWRVETNGKNGDDEFETK